MGTGYKIIRPVFFFFFFSYRNEIFETKNIFILLIFLSKLRPKNDEIKLFPDVIVCTPKNYSLASYRSIRLRLFSMSM